MDSPAPTTPVPRLARVEFGRFAETYGSLIALLLLVLVGCYASADFRQAQNFLNVFRQSSFVGIIAVGMTFVIILGGIDLSVGSMVALLGSISIWVLNQRAPQGPISAVVTAAAVMLVAGSLLGLFNGLLIAKGRITAFIATLGTMAAFRSIGITFAHGGQVTSTVPAFGYLGAEGIPLSFIKLSDGRSLSLDYPVLIFIVVAVVAHLILKRTRLGLFIHAIGNNEKAAQYSAIHIDRVRILTYGIVGLICGVAAFLVASRHESVSSSQTGLMFELDAIAAVVVGGTSMAGGSGRVFATVVGVLILGFVNNLMSMVITPWLQTKFNLETLDVNHLEGLIKGAIIIAAVLIQRGRKAT